MVNILLIWLLFIGINILLAYSNNKTRLKRIAEHNYKQIEHAIYAIGYAILCIIPIYFVHNYLLFMSLMLLHISIFPVAYNTYRNVSTFYLSKTTESIIDKFMLKIGMKSSELVNISSFFASIILLFI